MAKQTTVTGMQLINVYHIPASYGRYSEWGNFYGLPQGFPFALIDSSGYVVFPDHASLVERDDINVVKRINVPNCIKNIEGYIHFLAPYLPEELPRRPHFEGAGTQITVNRYERDRSAREDCIKKYRHECAVCKTLLSQRYGSVGDKVIHIHRLTPIATIGATYHLDPVRDLRPVCPNCHAMLHQRDPPFSIEELQSQLITTVA